jgi:hypothetical protein
MAQQLIGIGASANDGTGDPLRTAFDKVNDNFNELYVIKLGSYNYQSTLGSVAFTGTPIKLSNNGAGSGTNKTYGLTGVADVFNTTTNQFDFSGLSLGDMVNIRYDYTITTSAVNQESNLYLSIGIGGASSTTRNQHDTFFKVAGAHPATVVASFLIVGDLGVLNFPTEIYFTSEANASVVLNGFLISVIKR